MIVFLLKKFFKKVNSWVLDFVESLRLDYKDWNGNRPFPDEGNSYGIIRFKTNAIDDYNTIWR